MFSEVGLPLYGVLGSSANMYSRKFAARNSYMAYKDMPCGRYAKYPMLATVVALINKAGLTSVAPL